MRARTAGPQSRTSPNRCVVASAGTSAAIRASNSAFSARDRRPRQDAGDREIAVEVEEVALRVVHGRQPARGPGSHEVPVGREHAVARQHARHDDQVEADRGRGAASRMCVDPSAIAPISPNAAIRVTPPVRVRRGPATSISRTASTTSSRRTSSPSASAAAGQVRSEVRLGVLGDPAGLHATARGGARCRARRRGGVGHADEALVDVPAPTLDHRRARQPLRSRIGRAMSGLSTTNANIARSPQRPRNRWP